MNFRRQPFQFTAIDPAKRQAELQKRFGLPSDEMYVDCVNPGIMGGSRDSSSASASPRLQHRVPLFTQGFDQAKPELSQNVDTEYKPRIRNIPIEIEGADGSTKRHRSFSGPTNSAIPASPFVPLTSPFTARKAPTVSNSNEETTARPKVCNIPIQIETGAGKKKVLNSPEPSNKKVKSPKTNGCAESKMEKNSEPAVEKSVEKPIELEKPAEPDPSVPLKQIEDVLTKLKTYNDEVEKFTGTAKDKKYRYLDEMLTRCMLDLDNVDTLGLDNVRQSRKAAVRQVQASIDLLETKINAQSFSNGVETNADVEMKESSAVDMESGSTSVECETIVETSQSASQEMETDPVTIENKDSVDQLADPAAVSMESNDTSIQTEDSVVESQMEVEKSDEPSVIVEEVSDATFEIEESNPAEITPVTQSAQDPVIEIEESSNETETVKDSVELETLNIQIEENNDSVSEPIVIEPVDSNPQTDSADAVITELEQSAVDSCETVVTEIKELDNMSTMESDETLVAEMTENQNNSVNSVPVSIETTDLQAVQEQCSSNTSS